MVDPVAIQVWKRGRWVTVAKVTYLEGNVEPVLAMVWRKQHGTRRAISLPTVVLDFARQLGVQRFFLRDDRKMLMLCCDIGLFERGRLQSDGERYLPLEWFKPVQWKNWRFAERVVRLEQAAQPDAGRQLQLWTA